MKKLLKKAIYSIAYALYKIFWKYPRIMNAFYRLNDRFHIINSKGEVHQIYRASGQNKRMGWKDAAAAKPTKPIMGIKVAAVLDEFTYNCFKFECNLIAVEPGNWLDVFRREQPDIFFCESAWSGADSERRPWLGRVYTSENRKRETREALLSILAYCKDHNIPTLFWNKEDPTHFDDKVHNFVDTAVRFDYIFTTDASCVERYRKEYKHKNVFPLMFATQPKLFNPIETYDRTEDVIFAGSWYSYHSQRCNDMAAAFDKILASGHGLVIYNRNTDDDPNHIYPDQYKPYLRPPLSYQQMDRAYKASKYALNINTVMESDTMFARRVFELMSSNTLVITNYSKGIDRLFGVNVFFTDREWDFSQTDHMRSRNLYDVLANHTYKERFQQMLNDIGYIYNEEPSTITIYYVVDDEDGIRRALDAYEGIRYVHKRCVLILSEQVSPIMVAELHNKYQATGSWVKSMYHCQAQAAPPRLESEFFIFSNEDMNPDFLTKAVLHFKYIEHNVSVHSAVDKKYVFELVTYIDNRLFSKELHDKVFWCKVGGCHNGFLSFGI